MITSTMGKLSSGMTFKATNHISLEEGLKILQEAETELQKVASRFGITLSADHGPIHIYLRSSGYNPNFEILRRKLTELVPF